MSLAELQAHIANIDAELVRLRGILAAVESGAFVPGEEDEVFDGRHLQPEEGPTSWPLSLEEYKRYGRQMIVPMIGLRGQTSLKEASVLIVGIGGLGCPAAAYLAGAGIGRLGLVDGDVVEVSNLHRQMLHRTYTVGWSKVDSAIIAINEINPNVVCVPHRLHLTAQNAGSIMSRYDVVVDCTDRPSTRYLVSDAAVVHRKPLITAAALGTEGQLMVLNDPPRAPGDSSGGPCYRCIFPQPPPPDTVLGCSEGGILGPVVGTMGVLQAMEVIKIVTGYLVGQENHTTSPVVPPNQNNGPSLLLFSACSVPPIRNVRLRRRRPTCVTCSASASVNIAALAAGSMDYASFCGLLNIASILRADERVAPRDYQLIREHQRDHVLVDVREKTHFDLCSLPGSVNIPWSYLRSAWSSQGHPDNAMANVASLLATGQAANVPIYVICRNGNDSQLAVRRLKGSGSFGADHRYIGDIRGGFRAWRTEVDPTFPDY